MDAGSYFIWLVDVKNNVPVLTGILIVCLCTSYINEYKSVLSWEGKDWWKLGLGSTFLKSHLWFDFMNFVFWIIIEKTEN